MTATARDRRDRLRAMLADLKMPGALEAVDGVLAKVDSGAVTAALIDRLLHHCHIVNIRGNSYRMREHQHWLRTASDEQREGVAT